MNTSYAPLISFLGVGTLFFNILIAAFILVYLSTISVKRRHVLHKVSDFFRDNSMAIALVITSTATVSSLFLSEIVKFPPCTLCWYQRIFMYPQVVIFGIALYVNDKRGKIYALVLSIIGLIIAAYHTALQYFPSVLPCTSEGISCSLRQVEYFGYITIPVMSATAFLAVILVLLFGLRKK